MSSTKVINNFTSKSANPAMQWGTPIQPDRLDVSTVLGMTMLSHKKTTKARKDQPESLDPIFQEYANLLDLRFYMCQFGTSYHQFCLRLIEEEGTRPIFEVDDSYIKNATSMVVDQIICSCLSILESRRLTKQKLHDIRLGLIQTLKLYGTEFMEIDYSIKVDRNMLLIGKDELEKLSDRHLVLFMDICYLAAAISINKSGFRLSFSSEAFKVDEWTKWLNERVCGHGRLYRLTRWLSERVCRYGEDRGQYK